mmetsp:Transcript_8080/g.22424  ORF Transcript_8080/g.22424 Transcript_8080/m.22424 type:complete len:312 (+) Transcript_8080:59-994(+)
MKFSLLVSLATLSGAAAFSVAPSTTQHAASLALFSTASPHNEEQGRVSRRQVLSDTTAAGAALAWMTTMASPLAAHAEGSSVQNVVVAGATGQTGSRIYERLLNQGFTTTGGVRNLQKAKLPSPDNLKHLDVVEDSLDSLTALLKGTDGLIIACGMNPGKNLLRMSAAAHEVDNLGTKKLIQAAKDAGVSKVVLVSSILTNGRGWGQQDSPGFVATNAFGGALDEKLEAEKFLRSSGLDYTIVRPGGLKAKAPTGALSINAEDTLNSGEISRDLVAEVCIASLKDPKASNKVLEIIEDEGVPPKVFNGLVM